MRLGHQRRHGASQSAATSVGTGGDLYDTSDAYGTGHCGGVLGATFGGVRDQGQFATKWGNTIDSPIDNWTGEDASTASNAEHGPSREAPAKLITLTLPAASVGLDIPSSRVAVGL